MSGELGKPEIEIGISLATSRSHRVFHRISECFASRSC